jgi:hypothetical protein
MFPTVPGRVYEPGPGANVFLILVFLASQPNPTATPPNPESTSYYPGPGLRCAFPTPKSLLIPVPTT